jgi:hypothetical protein
VVTALAPVRYALAVSVAGQRWLGPTAAYVALLLALAAQGGDVGTTLAEGLAVVFPAGAWLAASLIRAEPPDRVAVAASVVGGVHRARATTVLVTLLWAQAWIAVSLLVTVLFARGVTVGWLVAGALGHEAALAASVVVGALCAPPVVDRVGWGVAIAAAATVAELVVPHALPVRLLVDAFGPSGGHVAPSPPWTAVLGTLAATLLAAPVLLTVGWRLAYRRR